MRFLTDSPRIASRVDGSNRENLDSEICEGLRQQVGDVGHTSAMIHLASGALARPVDLTPQMLKRRSRRSEGGQIVQELNSTREGKYSDDVKGKWVGSILDSEGARGGDAVRKEAVYEKVPMSPCWKETGKEPHRDRLGGHEQWNVRVSEHKISMGREGIQDPGSTCSAQHLLWSE